MRANRAYKCFVCVFFSFSLFLNYYLYDLRHIAYRRISNWIQTNRNVDINVVVVVVAFYSCVHACNERSLERRRKIQKEITISNLSILFAWQKRKKKPHTKSPYQNSSFIVQCRLSLFLSFALSKKLHWNWWYYVYFEPCLINGTARNLNVDGKKVASKRARGKKSS